MADTAYCKYSWLIGAVTGIPGMGSYL
nr:photosystem II subunit J [Hypecoum erectum]BET06338.1 photosystem II subunit J [Hypecoum erectum]